VTNNEIARYAAQWDGRSAEDVLAWATDIFTPRIGFATGFGAEGCVLVHLIAEQQLPVDVFTLDTGVLFPETYELWQRLECRYDVRIRGVQPSLTLERQAAEHGPALWAREPDRCCAIRKTGPLSVTLPGFDAWITAIRRDQTAERRHTRVIERDAKFGLIKVNPLAGWTHDDVWEFIREHDVPYNPLHDRGYPSIGCEPCTTPVAPGEDARAGRWRGYEKTECGLHVAPAVLVSRPLPLVRHQGA
jgi:phosphoadenylyl-sulfate reductase (thioredoxin)